MCNIIKLSNIVWFVDTLNIKLHEEKMKSGTGEWGKASVYPEVSPACKYESSEDQVPQQKQIQSSVRGEDWEQFKFHTRWLFIFIEWGEGGRREGQRERGHSERHTNETDPMFSLSCRPWICAPGSLTGGFTYMIFSQGPLSFLDILSGRCVTH